MWRPPAAHTENLMEEQSLLDGDEPPPQNDSTSFMPEPFPEEAAEAAEDEADEHELPAGCPLCSTLDDTEDNSSAADMAKRILEYESASHGRIPDKYGGCCQSP